MRCFRALVVAFLALGTGSAVASAGEWPLERQFPLVEPPPPLHGGPPSAALAEDTGGSLLVLVYWPRVLSSGGSETEFPATRVVRLAADGSRAFVPAFEAPDAGGHSVTDVDQTDEILPLRDGSLLFTRYNEIVRLRPNGRI